MILFITAAGASLILTIMLIYNSLKFKKLCSYVETKERENFELEESLKDCKNLLAESQRLTKELTIKKLQKNYTIGKYSNIISFITSTRQKLNLTIEEVCSELENEISKATLQRIENNKTMTSYNNIYILLNYYNKKLEANIS